jgi:hypothetical protein
VADKFDVIIRLEALDTFGDRRLGDAKFFGCSAEAAFFDGKIKDLGLI